MWRERRGRQNVCVYAWVSVLFVCLFVFCCCWCFLVCYLASPPPPPLFFFLPPKSHSETFHSQSTITMHAEWVLFELDLRQNISLVIKPLFLWSLILLQLVSHGYFPSVLITVTLLTTSTRLIAINWSVFTFQSRYHFVLIVWHPSLSVIDSFSHCTFCWN